MIGATAISAAVLVFAVFRLFFGPTGFFSGVDGVKDDGSPDSFLFGWNLTALAIADPAGMIVTIVLAAIVGFLVLTWARSGENARLFPVWVGGLTTGLVAAAISAPIAAGVFGGVTGGGTDALVALFRTLGLNVFQSAFAQGLTSDPLDKTISYTIVFAILGALPVSLRTMYSRGEATVVE
jgi:energy-coupling factor transport system substrate-specific component